MGTDFISAEGALRESGRGLRGELLGRRSNNAPMSKKILWIVLMVLPKPSFNKNVKDLEVWVCSVASAGQTRR